MGRSVQSSFGGMLTLSSNAILLQVTQKFNLLTGVITSIKANNKAKEKLLTKTTQDMERKLHSIQRS